MAALPSRAVALAIADALGSRAAAMRQPSVVRGELTPRDTRLMDMLDIRSARALGDRADFFLWRRGQAKKVGRPEGLEARDAWAALPEVEPHVSYSGALPPRAWGQMNPEHHFAVRVKDEHRKRITPELARALMDRIYAARAGEFANNAHGTTGLVNLPLRDLKRLYNVTIPAQQPKRLFNARVRRADRDGFAELDLRTALQAALRE